MEIKGMMATVKVGEIFFDENSGEYTKVARPGLETFAVVYCEKSAELDEDGDYVGELPEDQWVWSKRESLLTADEFKRLIGAKGCVDIEVVD